MKLISLFLCVLLAVSVSGDCTHKKEHKQTFLLSPDNNVIVVDVRSTYSNQDIVLWERTSASQQLEVITTVYSDIESDLNILEMSSSYSSGQFSIVLSSKAPTTSGSVTDETATDTSNANVVKSPLVLLVLSSFLFTIISKNKVSLLVSVVLASILLQACIAHCPSHVVVRVRVPDTVYVTCGNGECFTHASTAKQGVNVHFTNPRGGVMPMINDSFRLTRMDLGWGGTEVKKGQYNFASYDTFVEATTSFGIIPYLIFDYSNPLYDNGTSPHSPEAQLAFAEWATAAVEHFQGKGIIWEMYNEPNIGFWKPFPDVNAYSRLALTVGSHIKSKFPNEIYIGPASSGIDLQFLEACFKSGTLTYWDAVSTHPYRQTNPENVVADYRKARRLIAKYQPTNRTKIPVLAGEWGYSTKWDVSFNDEQLGRFLPRQWLINLISEVPVTVWYDWMDDGTDPNEREHHFGTVYNTYYPDRDPPYDPKPNYIAAKTFRRLLADYRFNKQIVLSNVTLNKLEDYVAVFSNEGNDVPSAIIAAWTLSDTPHEVRIPFGKGQKANVVSVYGNTTTDVTADADGYLSITITNAPQYIIATDLGDFLRVLIAVPRLPIDILCTPNSVNTLNVAVPNPTLNSLTVSVNGMGAEEPVEAGEVGAFELDEECDNDLRDIFLEVSVGDLGTFTMSSVIVFHSQYWITPLGLASPTSMSFAADASQKLQGKVSVSLNGSPYQEFNLNFDDLTAPPKNFTINTGSSNFTLELQLTDRASGETKEVVGPYSYAASDVYSTDTANQYVLVPDGDNSVASTQSFTVVDALNNAPFIGIKTIKVDYQYDPGWKFVRVATKTTSKIPGGRLVSINTWVLGDGTSNSLTVRLRDATGQTFQLNSYSTSFTGWKLLTFTLDTTSHWGGANDGIPHYPLSWDTYLIIDGNRSGSSGSISFAPPLVVYK